MASHEAGLGRDKTIEEIRDEKENVYETVDDSKDRRQTHETLSKPGTDVQFWCRRHLRATGSRKHDAVGHCGDPRLEDYVRMIEESIDWTMEPVRQPGAFDFGDGTHFRRGMDFFSGVMRKRIIRSHPMNVYWNRSIFGLKALLYRLRAQVDVNEIVRRERPDRSSSNTA